MQINKDYIHVYDIDGVIAETDPNITKSWTKLRSHFSYFISRKMIYKPKQKFFLLVSARAKEKDYLVTVLWLALHGIMPWRYKLYLLSTKKYDLFSEGGRAYYKCDTLSRLCKEYLLKKKTLIFFEDSKFIRDSLRSVVRRYPEHLVICSEKYLEN